MPFGPTNITTATAVDMGFPAPPGFLSIIQKDNRSFDAVMAIPTTDANGDTLTGLVGMTICSMPMLDGKSNFKDRTMVEVLAMPGVAPFQVALTIGDAGTLKTVAIAIRSFGVTEFVVAATDGPF